MGMFSTTGIRGIVGEKITPQLALEVGRTFGTFLDGSGNVLIGMDSRTSSEMLKSAVVSGLISTGVSVTDAGLVPIPALGYTASKDYDGAIMITSSHNPPQYNGFKFILENGLEITAEAEEKFEEIYNSKEFISKEWKEVGSYSEQSIVGDYIEEITALIDIDAITKSRLRVAVDTGNGAQSILIPELLETIGCKVLAINTKPKGDFNRDPEPNEKTLQKFEEFIRKESADIGIAYDTDGDRSIFLNEKGEVLMGDVTGTLLARELLSESKRPIVTTVATSKIIDDVIEKSELLIKTRVGGKHVAKELLDTNGVFGFEEGGGCIFRDFNLTRDADFASAKMIEILAKSGKKFSELIAELPNYYQLKGKVECPDEKKEEIIKRAAELFKEGASNLITIDGVKALYEDGSVLIRASGTEPTIRVFSEATTRQRAEEIHELSLNKVKELV